MFKHFCELCYDTSWIRKRGGCSGLQILFSIFLTEEKNVENKFSNLLVHYCLTGFRAILFIFSDISTNVYNILQFYKIYINLIVYFIF